MLINVQLFGSARGLYHEPQIAVQMPNGASVNDLRQHLLKMFQTQNSASVKVTEILNSSVFATDSEILANETQLYNDVNLVIMPPVCGG